MTEFSPIPIENIGTAKRLCEPVCVELCVGVDGLFGHHAMAMLFAVADCHFLVTCRHAVHDVVSRGAGLWVADDSKPGKAFALTPKFHFAHSDLHDLAVMKLPDDFVRHFSSHRFARAIDTHSSFQPEGISCVMAGAVASECETWEADVTADDKKLKTTIFIGRTTSVASDSDYIDDNLHFLITADNLVANCEPNGETREPPDSFRGLSGTPVFAVNENPFVENWNAHDCKIIGIQSAVIKLYKEKRVVMRVMRIEWMFDAIRQLFPSTAETLDKMIPITVSKRLNQIIIPNAG